MAVSSRAVEWAGIERRKGVGVKIGIKIGPAKERGVMDLAKGGATLGFHSVWVSERGAVPLDRPHPYEPSVDPWITLAFVAAVTERVILGTSVSQIALRPPVLMARSWRRWTGSQRDGL